MTAMFTRHGLGDGVAPSPQHDEETRTRDAYVHSRLAEIQASNRRPINRALRRLGRATARYLAADAHMELARRRVNAAETASSEVHRMGRSPRGTGYDSHSRALGSIALAAVLVVCVLVDYLVDRSAMQVLLLPLRITQALALFVAVVQMGAAHTVGRLLRRQKEVLDQGALRHERTKMRLLIGLLTTTVIGMAALRLNAGMPLLGAVMFGVGAAATVTAVTASYLHANTRLDAVVASDRALGRRVRNVSRKGRRLVRAEAEVAVRRNDVANRASTIATAVDLVYAAHGTGIPLAEPAWVGQVRRWAAGHDLRSILPPASRDADAKGTLASTAVETGATGTAPAEDDTAEPREVPPPSG